MIDHDYTPTTLHSHQCQAPECIPPELLDICHLGNNISLAKSMFDIALFIQNPEEFFFSTNFNFRYVNAVVMRTRYGNLGQ